MILIETRRNVVQSFTTVELAWLSKEMKELAGQRERMSQMTAATNVERELYHLRAEQFSSIADRLAKAVENGDRRIEIRRV